MKVDEQFKCKDCDNYNLCKYYHNRRETSSICKEFQNQWGFIKEFEKIKAEFEEDKYILLNQITAIKVIDNYIAELKGEQK